MTSSLQLAQAAQEQWCWPVNLSSYDRSAVLTPSERVALGKLTETPRFSPKWEIQFGACLACLLHPLNEVLAITGASRSNRNGTVIILLREMHRLQTSFWAWSEQEWIGVLYPSAAIFAEHHGGADAYRSHLLAVSYLLGGLSDLAAIGHFTQDWLAVRVFGRDVLGPLVEYIGGEMIRLGFGKKMVEVHLHNLLYELLLMNRSPRLEDLSFEVLTAIRPKLTSTHLKSYIVSFTHALVSLGYLDQPITVSKQGGNLDTLSGVPSEWLEYCERWRKTSTLSKHTRKVYYWCLIKTGRWLAQYHPEVVSPEQWTRQLAAEYVAATLDFHVGDWTHRDEQQNESNNAPLSAKTKVQHLKAVSSFLRDCQEWNWIPRRFDSRRAFTTPARFSPSLAPIHG
ncbi:hypothetical protein KDW_40530 [Dictyobacter vulcani]|uniref:Core-binding (CB) domain-containing protein n=1 Tax=Dictyobacter vulcani TaxID=2607529 RepID=A0A5J4KTU3_9CHLR|nr:hypothetical protein [Dictyobacter vulcani]GER89891.1 hypothetical protein KDW_40530 [Dictyobacter vulcani]